MLTGNLRA